MSAQFVPLLSRGLSKPAQTTEASTRNVGPFSPTFLQNEESLTTPAIADKRGEPGHDANCRPTVTLERDGDYVRQIRIRCGCGDVIELDCSY